MRLPADPSTWASVVHVRARAEGAESICVLASLWLFGRSSRYWKCTKDDSGRYTVAHADFPKYHHGWQAVDTWRTAQSLARGSCLMWYRSLDDGQEQPTDSLNNNKDNQ